MFKDDAVIKITEYVKVLRGDKQDNTQLIEIQANNLVINAMDYCHRNDLPEGLIMPLAECIANYLGTQDFIRENGNVKALTMDETRIEYNPVDTSTGVSLDTLYPTLNKYRKVLGVCELANN